MVRSELAPTRTKAPLVSAGSPARYLRGILVWRVRGAHGARDVFLFTMKCPASYSRRLVA